MGLSTGQGRAAAVMRLISPARESRIALLVASWLIYPAAFFLLYPWLPIDVAALAMLPVATTGWLFGARAGLVGGLLGLVVNTLLLNLIGYSGWDAVIRVEPVDHLFVVALGPGVGWWHESGQRLRRELALRKRVEQALRENEERFRQLAENIQDVFWLSNLESTKVFYVSPSYERVWGQSCESLYERPQSWMDAIHPEDRDRILAALQDLPAAEIDIEYRIVRPDGTVRWIRDHAFPVRDERGMVYRKAGIASDITERKLAQEQIRRHSEDLERLVQERTARLQELERQRAASEKLAATGRMAARIAHKINNPLAGIKNAFLLVKDAVPREHPYYKYVDRIEHEIDRISSIVRQMFFLYRPAQEIAQRCRVDDIIRDVVALLESTGHQQAVTVKLRLPETPLVASLQEAYLRQVLTNLLLNAIEASSQGGQVELGAAVDGKVLTITVADQGTGIPEEIRPHIFEPFFTTKAHHQGLGLGLAISRSMVEAMGGSVHFESGTGRGTTFRVALPIQAPQAEEET